MPEVTVVIPNYNGKSCQGKMLDYQNRHLIDDAGDYYCALGWAFARGPGVPYGKRHHRLHTQ